MASTIDIFNSKIDVDKLVGGNNFFNKSEEITEFNKLQKKYISNVDYSNPSNFAKFGSAEEYYKTAISYINSSYPYDGSTTEKLSWVNSLNEFEYYTYKNSFPRATGYVNISGSQYIKVFSHVQELESDTKTIYDTRNDLTDNTNLNLVDGITVESWLNFTDSSISSSVLNVYALSASDDGLEKVTVLNISRTSGSSPQFTLTDNINTYNFSTTIVDNAWHHYAIYISTTSASLFKDGTILESIPVSLNSNYETMIFVPLGLMLIPLEGLQTVENGDRSSVFEIGGGAQFSADEFRIWNGKRSVEKIGRYWFTHVDGNDFLDPDNSKLLFYYKFNEGWDEEYGFLCLDYSGRENDGEIINYANDCRSLDSGIDISGLVQDIEEKDIIFKGLSYSQVVKEYQTLAIQSGIEHDEENIHLLYNKFPGWILEDEEGRNPKHLKQIIQIISVYFDDLYNKIGEITEYKKIDLQRDSENIYPFYDKILTSHGFNVTDLFTNLDIVEKVSSRNDTTLFDEDIQKIKNTIFQNIYNNLAYILKSKGTEKALKGLLRAYGLNENLVRINVYPDGADYKITDRLRETVVKKKTIGLRDENIIYLSSTAIEENTSSYYYTLETSVKFDQYNKNIPTASIFGIQNNLSTTDVNWSTNQSQYWVGLENNISGSRFMLFSGSSHVGSSPTIKDFYDDTVWNLVLRKKPDVDDILSAQTPLQYKIELYGVNTNRHFAQEFSCSIPYDQHDGNLRYFIGAKKVDLTGSLIYPANSKFLYCNFWTDYLDSETIKSHNRDIMNYGSNE